MRKKANFNELSIFEEIEIKRLKIKWCVPRKMVKNIFTVFKQTWFNFVKYPREIKVLK
jgi:hypothetical protein